MSKKENLIHKLTELEEVIDIVKKEVGDDEKEYLNKYKKHVNCLIEKIRNGEISASNGGLLGVLRAISEYDNLAEIKQLYDAASEVEIYYSCKCKEW